jgi:chromosomal replication initiator protein
LKIEVKKTLGSFVQKFMASVNDSMAAEIWQAVLGRMEIRVPRSSFTTWLEGTEVVSHNEKTLTIGVPNAFTAKYLEDRLLGFIEDELIAVESTFDSIVFVVAGDYSGQPILDKEKEGLAPQSTLHINKDDKIISSITPKNSQFVANKLNPNYTFENFVVGDCNQLAYAGAKAISESTGTLFNPFVIYSDPGLGKTHLLHAIGHSITEKGLNFIYTTCEEFTNQYIRSIQENTTESFREKYRSTDVLLIDDIQFLIGKEQTQEGFFHTFNELHMANKQIIVASDRPVSNLSILEKRITSRLSGGLTADIQPPEYEMRLAILRAKSLGSNPEIPGDIIEFISAPTQTNIRILEGLLNRVLAWAQFRPMDLSLDSIKQIMPDIMLNGERNVITDRNVIDAVSEHFGVPKEQIRGASRKKMTVLSRQVAMYLLREETPMSLKAIGSLLGGRDHSTVLHGHDRVASMLNSDYGLKSDVKRIRKNLMSIDTPHDH